MIRFSRVAAVLLLLSLLSGAFVGPATAQANETIEIENSTVQANETAANETAGNETAGDDDGMLPSFPGFGDLFEWVQDEAAGVFAGIIEASAQVLIGTPVPDNAGWNGVFGTPTNEPYQSLYEPIYEGQIFPFALAVLTIMILLLAGFLPYSSLVGSYRVYVWLLRLLVAVFALILAWPLAGWMHQVSNSVAWAFAPSSADIGSLEGALTLGSTAAPIAGSIYLFGWAKIILYAFIYYFRYQMLFWMPFAFPVLLVLTLAAPHKRLRSFGSFGLWQYVGLLIMTWPNAVMFGAAYRLNWSFGASGLMNVGLIMGMFLTGILVPIGIMYAMSRGPGLVTGVMMGAASSTAQGVRRRSEQGWTPNHSPRSAISNIRSAPSRARARTRTTYERTQSRIDSARSRAPSLSRPGSSSPRSSTPKDWNPNNKVGSTGKTPGSSSSEIKQNYGSESTDRTPKTRNND